MTHTECSAQAASSIALPKSLSEPVAAPPRPERKVKSRKRLVLTALGLLLGSGVGLLAVPAVRGRILSRAATAQAFETAEVKSAPFRITVEAKGTVNSARNAALASEVRGFSTIISLIPAGTMVNDPVKSLVSGTVAEVRTPEGMPWEIVVTDPQGRPFTHTAEGVGEYTRALVKAGDAVRRGEILIGDVVCEFDRSELLDDEKELRIQVTKAQAAFEMAEKNIEIRNAQNESNMAAAKLKADLAKLDLEKYAKGEFPQSRDKIQGQVEEYRRNLASTEEYLTYTERMAQKGYKSLKDVENARLKVLDARLNLNKLEGDLKLLTDFTHRRTDLQLRETAANAARNLVRVRLSNEAVLAQLESALASRQRTLLIYRERWQRVLNQLKACTLVAPQGGQVVYARNRYSRNSELIEVGSRVRQRQAIIHIPDIRHMKVDARIHESMIGRIRLGLPAEIRVDALPGVVFKGRLTEISAFPLRGRFPNYDLKEYAAKISIDETSADLSQLRPDMTAGVQILAENTSRDLPQVPVQSVVSAGSEKFVWVSTPNGPQRRPVELGPSNDETFVVNNGLNVGEEVVLNPQDHFIAEIDDIRATYAENSDDWSDERPAGGENGQVASTQTRVIEEAEESGVESQQASNTTSRTPEAACSGATE